MTNRSAVTKEGVEGARPGREAMTGAGGGRKRSREQKMVPEAAFESYYGKPVVNSPVWGAPEIAGYLFLGGLAGASSVLGAGAHFTGRKRLARASKLTATGAIALSLLALVEDLGRPSRFLNMLRVFKPTSPMSVGSWVLSVYAPAAFVAAASEVSGLAPSIGAAATLGAAGLGPLVASYTSALIADTAVPAWHEAHRQLPFVFVSSAASAAGGCAMLACALSESAPARRLAIAGGVSEVVMTKVLEKELDPLVAAAYRSGKAGVLMRAAQWLTLSGAAGALFTGRRSRVGAAMSGAFLLAGSACTRFGVFFAGRGSAEDPAASITPQRERIGEALRSGAE